MDSSPSQVLAYVANKLSLRAGFSVLARNTEPGPIVGDEHGSTVLVSVTEDNKGGSRIKFFVGNMLMNGKNYELCQND